MRNLFVLFLLYFTGSGSTDVQETILDRARRGITTRTSLKRGRKKYTTEHEDLVETLISELPDDNSQRAGTDVSKVLNNGFPPSEKRSRLEAAETPPRETATGKYNRGSRQESSERRPTIDMGNSRVSDPAISESEKSVPCNITDSNPVQGFVARENGYGSPVVSRRKLEDEDAFWREIALSLSGREDEKIVAMTGDEDVDDDAHFWREIALALSDDSDDNDPAVGI